MSSNTKSLHTAVADALAGKAAHAATRSLFDGLNWKAAGKRARGAPHSVFQLLWHMSYWQDWVLKWLDGGNPPMPRHASASWPAKPAPASAKAWRQAVRDFRKGLDGLARRSRKKDLLAKRGKRTGLGMLHAIASHNSYHAGQVALVRQLLGAWPPPSGGVTW